MPHSHTAAATAAANERGEIAEIVPHFRCGMTRFGDVPGGNLHSLGEIAEIVPHFRCGMTRFGDVPGGRLRCT